MNHSRVALPVPISCWMLGAAVSCADSADVPPIARVGQAVTVTGASACPDNPCDAECHVLDGAAPGGVQTQSFAGTSGGLTSSVPGGFVNKALKDAKHPPGKACTTPADCQLDHRCDTDSGVCVPWGAGAYDPGANGPDLTLGIPCAGMLPICNRGSVPSAPGVEVVVLNGNSAQLQSNLGKCSAVAGGVNRRCTLNAPIAPGACVNAAACLPLPNGTKGLVVNSAALSATVPEVDCSNNWSVSSSPAGACAASTGYTSSEFSQRYVASCPAKHQSVMWTFMAYDAVVPHNASGTSAVRIEVQTAPDEASLASGCGDCAVLAQLPATHPASCPLGGSPPCPLVLMSALDAGAKHNAALELQFTLLPSPDGQVAPTVNHWEVRYTCVDDI